MRTINKVFLVGNLGGDPELRYSKEGRPIVRFNVATGHARKRDDGGWDEETDWHRVVAFGPLAENCSKYLRKGQPVTVEGRAHSYAYEDKDGARKFIHEVIAREVVFLSPRADAGEPATQVPPAPPNPTPPDQRDADVPF
jgi:single-strand DNA-binding protein